MNGLKMRSTFEMNVYLGLSPKRNMDNLYARDRYKQIFAKLKANPLKLQPHRYPALPIYLLERSLFGSGVH